MNMFLTVWTIVFLICAGLILIQGVIAIMGLVFDVMIDTIDNIKYRNKHKLSYTYIKRGL